MIEADSSVDLTAGKLAGGSALYDSEYDNYGPSSLASDDLYDGDDASAASGARLKGGEDKIRRVSQHITRSFGQTHRNVDTSDSDQA